VRRMGRGVVLMLWNLGLRRGGERGSLVGR
jgi:hypothetical protein